MIVLVGHHFLGGATHLTHSSGTNGNVRVRRHAGPLSPLRFGEPGQGVSSPKRVHYLPSQIFIEETKSSPRRKVCEAILGVAPSIQPLFVQGFYAKGGLVDCRKTQNCFLL